jgi:hypothetical protein
MNLCYNFFLFAPVIRVNMASSFNPYQCTHHPFVGRLLQRLFYLLRNKIEQAYFAHIMDVKQSQLSDYFTGNPSRINAVKLRHIYKLIEFFQKNEGFVNNDIESILEVIVEAHVCSNFRVLEWEQLGFNYIRPYHGSNYCLPLSNGCVDSTRMKEEFGNEYIVHFDDLVQMHPSEKKEAKAKQRLTILIIHRGNAIIKIHKRLMDHNDTFEYNCSVNDHLELFPDTRFQIEAGENGCDYCMAYKGKTRFV